MIDRGDARYMGPAYSDEAEYMLLNVPAGRMGAFPEDPEHFLKWVRLRGVRADQWDFLPRSLYREYVLDLLREAQQARTSGPSFEHVCAEVTDIQTEQGSARLLAASEVSFVADKVVLALGNFPPRHPNIENKTASIVCGTCRIHGVPASSTRSNTTKPCCTSARGRRRSTSW